MGSDFRVYSEILDKFLFHLKCTPGFRTYFDPCYFNDVIDIYKGLFKPKRNAIRLYTHYADSHVVSQLSIFKIWSLIDFQKGGFSVFDCLTAS